MRRLTNLLLSGLVTILPVGLTLYVVYWLGVTLESMLGGLLKLVLPERAYFPGLGLVAGVVVLFLSGLLVKAYIVRRIIALGEALLERIPLVKTIYGALKDFTRFFPAGGGQRDLKRVVTTRIGNARLIGFVTQEAVGARLFPEESSHLVSVYFPMSYQIGGYTLYLPRQEIEETDLTVEEGMRLVLIGGLTHEPAMTTGLAAARELPSRTAIPREPAWRDSAAARPSDAVPGARVRGRGERKIVGCRRQAPERSESRHASLP